MFEVKSSFCWGQGKGEGGRLGGGAGQGAGGPLCRQQIPPALAAASSLAPVRSWVKARLVRSMAGVF